MQLKPGVDGGGALPAPSPTYMGQHTVMSSLTANGTDGQAKAKKTSKTNGYRAKDLAEIRNGLQPFEKNEAASREPLRTISSLSTESSTNSVCSDGFSSVQEALQKFNILGYDEASAMRAVSMGDGSFNNAMELIQKQNEDLSLRQQPIINGVNSNHAGLTAVVTRKPSMEQRERETFHRASPAAAATEQPANKRCDSPGGPGGAPALPPRSTELVSASQTVPARQYSPPPLPPPRGANNPPPTPPRGTTPPPPLPPHNNIKRMSPVPGRQSQSVVVTRGTSPVARSAGQPMIVSNSLEAQQHVAHQMQALSLYPGGDIHSTQVEPPPPYPMGTAALNAPAPPTYSQTLAMRQSPTLSSTSSDYRRSPGLHYPNVMMAGGRLDIVNGTAGPTSPVPAAPSPVNSILSGSSRSSWSSQAWSGRQAKTHSPIIMQSVKSTQVLKPVLQRAHDVAPSSPVENLAPAIVPRSVTVSSAPPPPSYADSIQKKSSGPPTPVPQSPVPMSTTPVPTTCPPSYNASIQAKVAIQRGVSPQVTELPPPPPYPSTAVQAKQEPDSLSLVSASPVITHNYPVINTAKVVPNNANLMRNMETKQPLQRKYSPHFSETPGSSTSRSSSPVSGLAWESHQPVSASPLSFLSQNDQTDSGVSFPQDSQHSEMAPPPPPYKNVHHHTSPKPERKTYSREQDEIRNESKIKKYPPQAFKFFMEQHIENVIKYYEDRKKRRWQLEAEMSAISLDEKGQEQMRKMLSQKESNYIRLRRAKMDKSQFKKIKAIGLGAFGEVTLVRKIEGLVTHGPLYAMKTLKKAEVLKRNQVAHVKAERDILAEADNEWIVKLFHSFQDQNNLYFVMEYIPGGDLMSLLIKKGIFPEPLAKFYISELVCAVDSVHKMGFIHRDIKPDNILIDSNGHIKLTDFGLCTGFRWTHNSKYYQHNGHSRQDSMDPGNLDLDSGRCSCPTNNGQKLLERRKKREHARCIAHSLVGTPNYIAPEVLEKKGYSQLCDWWSVGVILYEMLVGQPPFLADNPAHTQYKVIRWYDYIKIPPGAGLSKQSKHLILALCTSADKRLGKNSPDEIKNHEFFKGINFNSSLRTQEAPYRPKIMCDTDTSNFDPIDPEKLRPDEEIHSDEDNNRDFHGFYEFTFRRFFDDAGHPVYSPGPNAANSSQAQLRQIDDNENPSGPVYV